MTDQSPPKRITRARAAAKSNDTGIKTTKIATAASKARAVPSTLAKRKTRSEDIQEHEEQLHGEEDTPQEGVKPAQRTTRGNTKKLVEPEPEPEMDEAPSKPTRGRPKKVITEELAPEPARSLRGRPKKTDMPIKEPRVEVEEASKRTTRGRATTLTKSTISRKTVKFEEPDKENIAPNAIDAKSKAHDPESGTGLRAKPVRKPAATRVTRGRMVAEEEKKLSPLSPKKATQVTAVKESTSEDELATNEKTPMKPLMRSPIKPPSSVIGAAKKLDFSNTITASHVNVSSSQSLQGSTMATPARRPPHSPFKETFKTSSQRAPLGGSMLHSPFKPSLIAPQPTMCKSSLKAPLLQSPARRPQSPTKISHDGSPIRNKADATVFEATPKASAFKISRFTTPKTLSRSVRCPDSIVQATLPVQAETENSLAPKNNLDVTRTVEPVLSFSGRLSSIMVKEHDPAFSTSGLLAGENHTNMETAQNHSAVPAEEIESSSFQISAKGESTTPISSPSCIDVRPLTFRETNNTPFDASDSEDELACASPIYSPIPVSRLDVPGNDPAMSLNPFGTSIVTPRSCHTARSERREKIGFTPLARQLSDWMGASPDKCDASDSSSSKTSPPAKQTTSDHSIDLSTAPGISPVKSTFFDDEMTVRDELASTEDHPLIELEFLEVDFEPVDFDEEDLALAHEADEMSLLESEQMRPVAGDEKHDDDQIPQEWGVVTESHALEQIIGIIPTYEDHLPDAAFTPVAEQPTPSEASQEYGDENAVPIDPTLLYGAVVQRQHTPAITTPKRILAERVCHTVSKVPLKPAAEDTPVRQLPLKRSVTISRLPTQRPSPKRNNTVISYSPKKDNEPNQDVAMEDVSTPSKTNWSTLGTPARTPRRDIDTALLKGAVVFVDVHTTEGADASVLFTELLGQMGARCVKSWSWNGNTEDSSKIGITHVVYKDGGKRTLEKVKQSGGVVSCVGVGWVLDCERENKWLDESLYVVDSGIIPRGGSRRRKSMEPKALANMNGTLVPSAEFTPLRHSSPSNNLSKTADTPVTNKSRRRESVQWVRSPVSSIDDDQTPFLLPVTPAPETMYAYAEDGLNGETPGGQTPYFLHKEQLVQKTAPSKRYTDTEQMDGEASKYGFLTEKKDENVMMRLMAARRKSLQFAPKIGSPLAKAMF